LSIEKYPYSSYHNFPKLYEGNTNRLICLKCADEFGMHHAQNPLDPKGENTGCYGIACQCDGFYHNLFCLVPMLEEVMEKMI